MRLTTETYAYGEFRFLVEFDTGSEMGESQLTVWVAEKVEEDQVPLEQYRFQQLLDALLEPYQSTLKAAWLKEKEACQHLFEQSIAELVPVGKRLSAQIKALRRTGKKKIEALKQTFLTRELLTLERAAFSHTHLQSMHNLYGKEQFLRTFYFKEMNNRYMRDFCRRYALDEQYREEVKVGRPHWVLRNKLFYRNLQSLWRSISLLSNGRYYEAKAEELFQWLDTSCEKIVALPEYQSLQTLDCAFEPDPVKIDPLISTAVEVLNQIPGVETQFSCQGISGKVVYQECEIIAISPHEEYAYITFAELGESAYDLFMLYLPDFHNLDGHGLKAGTELCIRSVGDNRLFRLEILTFARKILACVDHSWSKEPKNMLQVQQLYHRVSESGGLSLSRLRWLCSHAQIEKTFSLLFSLNYWANTDDRLLSGDRQGLYRVKEALLGYAYRSGYLGQCFYIDGSCDFERQFYFDLAGEMGAARFMEQLTIMFDDQSDSSSVDATVLAFLQRLGEPEVREIADIEAIKPASVEEFVVKALQELVAQAVQTHQPIDQQKLEALFIMPADLFEISCGTCFPDWYHIDPIDLSKLDPEGLSIIEFQYMGAAANYRFHLPFRIAEKYLLEEELRLLRKRRGGKSRESGICNSRKITEQDCQEHSLEEVLYELRVDVRSVCPYNLKNKQEYLAQQRSGCRSFYEGSWDELLCREDC